MITKIGMKFVHKEWVDESNAPITCEIEKVDYEKEKLYFRCLNNKALYWCRTYWFKKDHFGKKVK